MNTDNSTISEIFPEGAPSRNIKSVKVPRSTWPETSKLDFKTEKIRKMLSKMKGHREQQSNQNVLRAFYPCEFRKPEKRDGEEDTRVRVFTISTEARDRHGSVINLSAWNLNNYNNNGIVCYQHLSGGWWPEENDPDFILGPGKAYIQGKSLIGEVLFETEDINPMAEKIMKKIDYGTLKATSVGFIPIKGHFGVEDDGEDTGTYYFDAVDLVEFSIVTIPSNPEATNMQRALAPLRNYLVNARSSQPERKIYSMRMNENRLRLLKCK